MFLFRLKSVAYRRDNVCFQSLTEKSFINERVTLFSLLDFFIKANSVGRKECLLIDLINLNFKFRKKNNVASFILKIFTVKKRPFQTSLTFRLWNHFQLSKEIRVAPLDIEQFPVNYRKLRFRIDSEIISSQE